MNFSDKNHKETEGVWWPENLENPEKLTGSELDSQGFEQQAQDQEQWLGQGQGQGQGQETFINGCAMADNFPGEALTMEEILDQEFWKGPEVNLEHDHGHDLSVDGDNHDAGVKPVRPLVVLGIICAVTLVLVGVGVLTSSSLLDDSKNDLPGGASLATGAGESAKSASGKASMVDNDLDPSGDALSDGVAAAAVEKTDDDPAMKDSSVVADSSVASGGKTAKKRQGAASAGGGQSSSGLSYSIVSDDGMVTKKRSALPSAQASRDYLPDTLTTNQIMNVIRTKRRSLQSCFERQLRREGMLGEQKTTIKFEIGQQGNTGRITVEGGGDNSIFSQCVEQQIRRWKFPPFSGAPIPVEYPILLTATH